jgi:hypothetical protein
MRSSLVAAVLSTTCDPASDPFICRNPPSVDGHDAVSAFEIIGAVADHAHGSSIRAELVQQCQEPRQVLQIQGFCGFIQQNEAGPVKQSDG